jgi:tripartite-type tricarboxylate transporter receptor subunit TctC
MEDSMRRFGRAVMCAFALVLAAGGAPAQTYPSKPVRVVVPYAPGGLTDVVARLYSEQLRQSFGRNVFVENKPAPPESLRSKRWLARGRTATRS